MRISLAGIVSQALSQAVRASTEKLKGTIAPSVNAGQVKEARTPILILHGKDDPRVPPSQSLELYRHLKALGQAQVRLVWYPGEGHGNRASAARLDYNLRMLEWFEHYLKGPGGAPSPGNLDYDKN